MSIETISPDDAVLIAYGRLLESITGFRGILEEAHQLRWQEPPGVALGDTESTALDERRLNLSAEVHNTERALNRIISEVEASTSRLRSALLPLGVMA